MIFAIWRGSPCQRSSDDANTDWVHCLSRRCRFKWQTVLPAIWSQRQHDVGCATATMATDTNVVTMLPNVTLLAGEYGGSTFLPQDGSAGKQAGVLSCTCSNFSLVCKFCELMLMKLLYIILTDTPATIYRPITWPDPWVCGSSTFLS